MRFRSPRNPERKVRRSTELIVLHTTEAPARSSLNKVSDRGECHYCVTEDGSVYAIVDRDREAFHAGRSMWKGREDVDKFSVGIECVGYHDKPMPMVQLVAIRNLVRDLKAMYRLTDDRVVCHSHVAYGAPNKWHRFKHRGRKRCGMLFATPTVRRILGLTSRPACDVDVRACRLRNADDYLTRVLYGNVDTMASRYRNAAPARSRPAARATSVPQTKPPPTRPAAPARTASGTAPPDLAKKKTMFSTLFGTSAQRSKVPAAKSAILGVPATVAQLKSGGWVCRGTITKTDTALKLVGSKWNAADTYYVIRGRLTSGKAINPARIEQGMTVWIKRR